MRKGHIRQYRKEMDSYVWSLKPEYYKVWNALKLSVNWKKTTMDFAGEPTEIEPGQMVTGINHLTELAGKGVSESQTRRALEKFEDDGMIERKPTNEGTLITLLNWQKYQVTPDQVTNDSQATDKRNTNESQASDNQTTTYEEVNKGNKGKNKSDISDEARSLFEMWQSAEGTITHRTNTTEHRRAIQRRLDDGFTKEEIATAIQRLSELYEEKHNTWLTTDWSCRDFFTTKSGEHLEKMIDRFEHFLKNESKNGGDSNVKTGQSSANLERVK